MSRTTFSAQSLLVAAVAAALTAGYLAPAQAQTAHVRAEQRRAQEAAQQVRAEDVAQREQYPHATREEPRTKASAKLVAKHKRLDQAAYQDKDLAQARALAEEIIADAGANAYDKARAARSIGALLVGSDDAAAEAYLNQAIQYNGLQNSEHFEAMHVVADLQLQDKRYQEALATVERFLTESRSQAPEALVLKGNALFRLQRHAEAIAVLKPVIDASPEPRADWNGLLMAAYSGSGQPAEAARVAERIATSTPADKQAQLNLVAAYLGSKQPDRAAEVYEQLRAAGELTDDRDYRNLFAIYLNAEGKEAQAIAVINEGLQKGVLKPDHQMYVALAQAQFFSGQPGAAIEAYQKAAPLAPDGETALNLAKVLANEGRTAESKAAAQQALDKGVRNPEDARKLLAR
ncbi:tetratricopeptide repeat protein [soil metagenome]